MFFKCVLWRACRPLHVDPLFALFTFSFMLFDSTGTHVGDLLKRLGWQFSLICGYVYLLLCLVSWIYAIISMNCLYVELIVMFDSLIMQVDWLIMLRCWLIIEQCWIVLKIVACFSAYVYWIRTLFDDFRRLFCCFSALFVFLRGYVGFFSGNVVWLLFNIE